jgi:hypothetical protein
LPGYIARTRTWPAKDTGRNGTGTPGGVGMHGPVMLDWHSSPWPIDFTRTVAVGGRKLALKHGDGTGPAGVGVWYGQPATINGAAGIGTGTPINFTRGFGAVAFALPPCAHVTTHVVVSKKPGIR